MSKSKNTRKDMIASQIPRQVGNNKNQKLNGSKINSESIYKCNVYSDKLQRNYRSRDSNQYFIIESQENCEERAICFNKCGNFCPIF